MARRPAADSDPQSVLEELKQREPVFHRLEFGSKRADVADMTDPDFFEVGASGRRYDRDYVLDISRSALKILARTSGRPASSTVSDSPATPTSSPTLCCSSHSG